MRMKLLGLLVLQLIQWYLFCEKEQFLFLSFYARPPMKGSATRNFDPTCYSTRGGVSDRACGDRLGVFYIEREGTFQGEASKNYTGYQQRKEASDRPH